MAEPNLSVVIPCYNHGKYVLEALNSVINNDKKNICEIIIINDGSTDNDTIDVLNKLNIKNTRVYHQENQGLAKARNKGVELSNTEYLLILDSDNKIKQDFLDEFIKLFNEGNDFDMLHGNADYFGEKSGTLISGELNFFKICKGNYIDACSIIKKSSLIQVGGYDPNMPVMGWEDWDLWVRFAFLGMKTIYVDKSFFSYRYLNTSMMRTNQVKEDEIRKYFKTKYHSAMFDEKFMSSILSDLLKRNILELRSSIFIKIILDRILIKLKLKKSNSFELKKIKF